MKKLLTLLFMLIPMLSWAAVQIDGIWYIINQEAKVAEVTNKSVGAWGGGNSYSGNITIPESVVYNGTTYSVTSIGGCAFYECSGLTSIHITDIAAWCNIQFDSSLSSPYTTLTISS